MEYQRQPFDDGWSITDAGQAAGASVKTKLFVDNSRTIISRNQSPDVPFEQSINPYKGCEHGCSYCFARPTHAYLDLSPGLDFESKIFYKPNAAQLLEQELSRKTYKVSPIALGANTDAYQPIERSLGITRKIIQVLQVFQHPFVIITKSALVERDMDLLAPMAESGLVKVIVSVTTLDCDLSRKLEPRAASPDRRLQLIRNLNRRGIPVGILFAPVIPALNDAELENVLSRVAQAGASSAAYVVLRLPHELKDIFSQWLAQYYPLKAERVMNRIRDIRGGNVYSPQWGKRMSGQGLYADLIAQRFRLVCKKTGLNSTGVDLNTGAFTVPPKSGDQLPLF